jgi:hypothetical protein
VITSVKYVHRASPAILKPYIDIADMTEKSELAQLVPEAKYIEDVAAFVQGPTPQPL